MEVTNAKKLDKRRGWARRGCSLKTTWTISVVQKMKKVCYSRKQCINAIICFFNFRTGAYDPRLGQFLSNFLWGPINNRDSTTNFQRYAELFVYTTRGTVDERTNVLYSVIGMDVNDSSIDLAYPPIREFVEAVCSSYLRAVKLQNIKEYLSWESKGFRICSEFVQKLAESLLSDIVQQGTQKVTRKEAEKWFQRNPAFGAMLEFTFKHLYSLRPPQKQYSTNDDIKEDGRKQITFSGCLLPFCEGLEYVPDYPAFIDISQLIFINSNLPPQLRLKWRFLFSSQMHGESFSTLLGRITEQGPTVLIIEDQAGHIFGGFASEDWKISPNFAGDDTCFLFTLKPKMRCLPATQLNNHYQYLNLHMKTMCNGLGNCKVRLETLKLLSLN